MRSGLRLLAYGAACVFFLSSPPRAVAQEVGILEALSGRVYWQQRAGSESVRLHRRRDVGRILRAEERVRCGRNGRVRLRLFDKPLRISGPSGWFTVPHPLVSESDPRRKALKAYGDTGGIPRGESPIYSPAPLAKVSPALFEVRWTLKLPPDASVLLIREQSKWGRELWRQKIGGPASGRLVSKEARRALAKYREEHGHGPLRLVLLDGAGRELYSTSFSILTASDERSVARELAFWDKRPAGLWRRLGRAGVFIRHRMFGEGADEYEAALALAPESEELLRRTIEAHRQTGNADREAALTRRLPDTASQ